MPDTELDLIPEKGLEDLRKIIALTYRNLEKISRIIDNIDKEKRKELYKSMPGVSGYFDGFYLIGEDGNKYEVPGNYAAKSRIVFGDVLKMIDEDGKKLFKQIEKVPRKKLEGVLSKKEGKWYFLSDGGTYRISDIAAEFHKAELNDKAIAYIPENNLSATYAALDTLEKDAVSVVAEQKPEKPLQTPKTEPVERNTEKKRVVEKEVSVKSAPKTAERPQRNTVSAPAPKKFPSRAPKEIKKVAKDAPKPPVAKPEPSKEFVANIMDEDDLR